MTQRDKDSDIERNKQRDTEMESGGGRNRQTHRDIIENGRQRERETERGIDRNKERDKERRIERERQREKHRDRQRYNHMPVSPTSTLSVTGFPRCILHHATSHYKKLHYMV